MTDQRDLAKEVERISKLPRVVELGSGMQERLRASWSDIDTLLAFIASQSRELEELKCVNTDQNDWSADEISRLRAEITRLSSPPEERGEIVERLVRLKKSAGAGYDIGSPIDDIDTLIQDNIRYRNAHKILLAERDDARQSLKQESELHQARKDLVSQQAARIEGLQDALRALYSETADYITINHLGPVHWNRSMQMARDALAAADGQRDLLTAEQVLSTLTPEQRAATEALRQQMFGDLPSATGDGVEGDTP